MLRVARGIAAVTLLAAALGGCSEYFDRRDTVSLHSGEAMAANRVTMMIDPWSPASGNKNIAYNGERMQGAVERHRTHTIIQPVSPTTSAENQPAKPLAITTEAIGGDASSSSAPNPNTAVK
jgi:hypothetical protein